MIIVDLDSEEHVHKLEPEINAAYSNTEKFL